MQLLLLGPLEVRSDEGPAPLPGAAERALLALLGLSPGRSVSTSLLVDQLWSETTLPVDPQNALQVRVSKLRRALQNVGHDVLTRDSGGYRLDIDPRSVDVTRFVDGVHEARVQAREARDEVQRTQALHLFDEALALWRGEALVEFTALSWAEAEADRLTALRRQSLVERSELAISLGLHPEVVEQVAPMLARYPTDEPMAAVLMAAHAGAGQQAAALEVYQRARRSLDSDLGVEPSALLRRMHQRVLQQDPTLVARDRALTTRAVAAPPTVRPRHGAPADAPPPAASGRPRLPAAVGRLIGRAEQVAEAQALLGSARLVTLVGPGGAGKTSLALEVVRRVQEDYPDGVWLVRLAPVSDSSQVAQAVADALAVPVEGASAGEQASKRVLAYLARRRLLLVLDNCEHVVDAVAVLVDAVLTGCPDVTVLTTTREALAVPGELQLPVPPLSTPPDGAAAEEVVAYPAVRLLLERGRAVRPQLDVQEEDVLALAEVSRLLDGIPLALELAAARLSTLSPVELAHRLRASLEVLATGPRTADARQRTLRATMDWSYDLLGDAEQVALELLSVFRGGWTLDAATHVLAAGDGPVGAHRPGQDDVSGRVLDLMSRLVDRSLVLVTHGRPTRYRMLEPVRQYAAERLRHRGLAEDVALAHAGYFAELADRAEPGLHGDHQREWLRRLHAEQPNVRAALLWLTDAPDRVDGALSLAGALGWYWHLGRHVEGREVLARVTSLPGGSALPRARALQAVSLVERPRACLVHPSPVCRAAAQESLRLYTEAGRQREAAVSKLLLAVEGVTGGGGDSVRLLEEAESYFASQQDRWGLSVASFVRMETALKAGQEEEALRHGGAASETFRALDDPWGLSAVLYHLGWGLGRFGRYADAVQVLQEAVDVAASAELHNTAQWAMADQGVALLHLGDVAAAEACFARAEAAAHETGDRVGVVLAAYGRGLRSLARGDWPGAEVMLTEASAGFQRLGTPVYSAAAQLGVARCREGRDPDRAARGYETARQVGREAGEPALVAAAGEGLARIAAAHGDLARARRLLTSAAGTRQQAHRPQTPMEQADLARLVALLDGPPQG